jgi:hypothetical protein
MIAAAAIAAVAIALPPAIPPILHERCPSPEGTSCTWPGGPIYLDPEWGDTSTLLHELGHQFDYQAMHDPQRDAFRRLTEDSRPWRTSPNSPHEQFAEAYQLCATGTRPVDGWVWGGYRYRERPRRHRRICLLIQRAGDLAR